MDQSLSWRIQCSIIIIIFLLHGTMLVMLFIAQMQQHEGSHEAIVMVEDEFINQPNKTELDWAAVQQALPAAPAPAPVPKPVQKPTLDPLASMPLDALPSLAPAPAAQKNSDLDKQMDQTLALAQQMLEEPVQPKPVAKKKEPVPVASPDEPELDLAGQEPLAPTSLEVAVKKPAPVKKESAPKEDQLAEQPLAEFSHSSSSELGQQGKKMLSLAQLTQGFVGHLEQAAMAVKSNKTGAATAEQLKQLHFCQKIISCIVNSYKIHRMSAPHNREMNPARIVLVLNDNGSINSLQLHRSSGNPAIDKFLLDMFQDASSSFPPLPASFNQKTYLLPVFNIDRLEAFQSSQGWYIDNKIS